MKRPEETSFVVLTGHCCNKTTQSHDYCHGCSLSSHSSTTTDINCQHWRKHQCYIFF